MDSMWCIAPNKTSLSKLLRPFNHYYFILILSSFKCLPTEHSLFQCTSLIITIITSNDCKKKLSEIIMDLICHPKTRDTCIYVGIQAHSSLTMQYGHTEMKMPCVASSPNKNTIITTHPALNKIWGFRLRWKIHSSFVKSSKWLKSSSHRQHNPSNKGDEEVLCSACLQNEGSLSIKELASNELCAVKSQFVLR